MKRILALVLSLFMAQSAFADACAVRLAPPFVPSQANKLCVVFGTSVKNSLIPGTPNTIDLGSSSKTWRSAYLGTSLNFAAGSGINYAPYVPTLAATPAAGTNDFRLGRNAVPTAAANTAGCLPVSPADGATVEIENAMANAIRAKACGTPGVNGGAAGTYLAIAAWSKASLRYNSTLVTWIASTGVVPTPAGP